MANKMKPDETLILYHQPLCGFCWSVRDTISELGIEVELRDVFANREHADALMQARGRGTVGESEWMPESDEIIRYLITTYG